MQVTLNQTRAIEITQTGRFTEGKAEVEEAEISGVYEGDLTVHKRLLIRSTGRVKGTVRYGEPRSSAVASLPAPSPCSTRPPSRKPRRGSIRASAGRPPPGSPRSKA